MAFRFNEASTGSIRAFAEDYRVVETPSGCRLTWIMAMKPNGRGRPHRNDPGSSGDGPDVQKFLYNLRSYTDKRYATA